jgi:hypothetical protein
MAHHRQTLSSLSLAELSLGFRSSLQSSKEHDDVDDKHRRDEHGAELVIPFARNQNSAGRERDESELKAEVQRSGPGVIQHQVAADANGNHDRTKAKEVAPLLKIVRAKINYALVVKVGVDKPGHQIESDHLREQDGESAKVPFVPVAQAEHRPPNLGTDEEKKSRPDLDGPVFAHPRPGQHASAHSDENLRHGQAENDR